MVLQVYGLCQRKGTEKAIRVGSRIRIVPNLHVRILSGNLLFCFSMKAIPAFLERYKYELLLVGLIQHLFIGIILRDFELYTRIVWPVNMLILGFLSGGVFLGKGRSRQVIPIILFFLVFLAPISYQLRPELDRVLSGTQVMMAISLLYTLYFGFMLVEVLRYLIRPGYINADIIFASACGFLLIIEISAFLFQFFVYQDSGAFNQVTLENPATIFTDMVYFSTILQTTIGFGDITPALPHTKLLAGFFGILGHFYTVVLLGILISKFTSRNKS